MGFARFLLRGLDNIKAEAFVVATAFSLRSLFRGLHRQWNKTWKAGFAEVCTLISWLFLAFNIYIDIKISENGVITY